MMKVFPSYRWRLRRSMWNTMQREGWYFVVKVTTRPSIHGFGWLHGSNSLHPNIICVCSVLWMVLCSIWMVHPCLMWRLMMVCEVMHTSILSLSHKTGNWVRRITDSSISYSWQSQWRIVMVHCLVLAPSMWPRTRLHHSLWTHWRHRNSLNSILDMLRSLTSHHHTKKRLNEFWWIATIALCHGIWMIMRLI